MPTIFITRKIPDSGIKLLKSKGYVVRVYSGDKPIPRPELLRRVRGADAILSLLTDTIDAAVMDAAGHRLKIIANYAVGFDNVDVKAATARKIVVTNTPGVLTEAVAEHTVALMMAVARRVPESDVFMRTGKYQGWEPELLLGMELKGKTLGIVGLGRIGFRVAEMAVKGMGMKVVYNDVKPNADFEKQFEGRYLKLDSLLRASDVVSIHVPLLPTTKHLVNAKKFVMMKPSAILINTSRGPIVDEKALVVALRRKQIAGAGLDVFEFEPKLAPGLSKLSNVVLTPHTASATVEARQAMSRLAAENIVAVLSGKPPVTSVKI